MVYDQHLRSTNNNPPAIVVEAISKQFGDFKALDHVGFQVPTGSVLGLLGHNGAGKTTMVRILTTLATPTSGRATVAGFDVAKEPERVRQKIGVAAQQATVDGLLSARKNLVMVGRLHHMAVADVKRRTDELLARLQLADVADKLVKEFSGGMRRRLDLAASLIAEPPILFLDEPTTGLDPHSRNDLWSLLRERVRAGTTIVLTTQYLEEADRLADDVVLLDHGKIAAHGTPAALKQGIGGERVVVTLMDATQLERAREVLATYADGPITIEAEERHVVAPIRPGTRLVEIVRALDASGIDAHDVSRREVSLDDVFLAITGKQRPAPVPAANDPKVAA